MRGKRGGKGERKKREKKVGEERKKRGGGGGKREKKRGGGEKKIVRSGIRTHAYKSRLRPERSALDHSAILTPQPHNTNFSIYYLTLDHRFDSYRALFLECNEDDWQSIFINFIHLSLSRSSKTFFYHL